MSLDIYLRVKQPQEIKTSSGIFIRENGGTREISMEEWEEKFPGKIPVTAIVDEITDTVFDANITHNLGSMAAEAGIYKYLWRPEKNNIEFANQLINPLQTAIKDMEERPDYYKAFNAENGWGTYKDFVPWLKRLLQACIDNPDAKVESSR